MSTAASTREPTTPTVDAGPAADESWRQAGDAWGHCASDWAYLFEPYARDAAEYVFDEVGLTHGTELFDMACGSGYATARAARRGACTCGLDASTQLIEIARRRNPTGSFHTGSMFDLPFPDESFDVVTSFNGIWGGCDDAISEAQRVLRPGGFLAITFWGPGSALDYRDMFIALGGATASTRDEMIDMASIGAPGVAEAMYTSAGLTVTERGATQAVHEFPDEETAWRCLRSPGLMVPALEQLGEDGLRSVLMPTIEPFRSEDGSYRIVNELAHVIGIKPRS